METEKDAFEGKKKKSKKRSKEHDEENESKQQGLPDVAEIKEKSKKDHKKKKRSKEEKMRNNIEEKDKQEERHQEKADGNYEDQHKKKKKKKRRLHETEELEEKKELNTFEKGSSVDCQEREVKIKKKKSDRDSKDHHEDDSKEAKKSKSSLKEEEQCDVGQWGQASFESAEQKNKFIRLLGGFKNKGNTPDGKRSLFGGLKKFSSAAMSKDEESKLNNRLEEQYQHAFDTGRNKRGLGLGYDPSHDKSLKTFHIDTAEPSKSTKFE